VVASPLLPLAVDLASAACGADFSLFRPRDFPPCPVEDLESAGLVLLLLFVFKLTVGSVQLCPLLRPLFCFDLESSLGTPEYVVPDLRVRVESNLLQVFSENFGVVPLLRLSELSCEFAKLATELAKFWIEFAKLPTEVELVRFFPDDPLALDAAELLLVRRRTGWTNSSLWSARVFTGLELRLLFGSFLTSLL